MNGVVKIRLSQVVSFALTKLHGQEVTALAHRRGVVSPDMEERPEKEAKGAIQPYEGLERIFKRLV